MKNIPKKILEYKSYFKLFKKNPLLENNLTFKNFITDIYLGPIKDSRRMIKPARIKRNGIYYQLQKRILPSYNKKTFTNSKLLFSTGFRISYLLLSAISAEEINKPNLKIHKYHFVCPHCCKLNGLDDIKGEKNFSHDIEKTDLYTPDVKCLYCSKWVVLYSRIFIDNIKNTSRYPIMGSAYKFVANFAQGNIPGMVKEELLTISDILTLGKSTPVVRSFEDLLKAFKDEEYKYGFLCALEFCAQYNYFVRSQNINFIKPDKNLKNDFKKWLDKSKKTKDFAKLAKVQMKIAMELMDDLDYKTMTKLIFELYGKNSKKELTLGEVQYIMNNIDLNFICSRKWKKFSLCS